MDRDEIGRAFLLVGKPLKDSDVLAWLNEFDADGNGIIDEDEFAHMVRNRMGIACSITCIPCLRGCNSEQRRTKPVKPASKLKALRRPTVTSQFEKKCSPGWAGNQMLMSITERKREMMTNFLTRLCIAINLCFNITPVYFNSAIDHHKACPLQLTDDTACLWL